MAGNLAEVEWAQKTIGGMNLLGELGRGATSVVYLGQKDEKNYAIKVLKASIVERDPQALQRFHREAGILAKCSHQNLVKIFTVSKPDERPPYTVMEYIEGQSLAAKAGRGPLEEDEVLMLALGVASALGQVHKFGLIHGDVKPDNILISKDGTPKVIDFGLAIQESDNEESSAAIGTLIYSAPEQSGVLQRHIDFRSDLYSLGIVLYECLTGKPPYFSSDPGELIHLHLSNSVPPPTRPDKNISEAMSRITMKLMAKDPDDRYQSAESLIFDLQSINEFNLNLESQLPVTFGSHDFTFSQSFGFQLIGREKELLELKEKASRIRSGQGNAIVIRGESGSGKTRLAKELVVALLKSGPVRILSSKAKMTNMMPFGFVREALDGYLRSLPPDSEKQNEVFEKIRKACAYREGLLKTFSPQLKSVFPESAEQKRLPSNQEQLFDGLVELLSCLSSKAEPLVVLIDDLQWLDEPSMQVLKRLSSRVSNLPVLILASVREEEEGINKVDATFGELHESSFTNLNLEPLDYDSTKKLVSEYLGGSEIDEATANLIWSRSNGNAFAAQQFVSTLFDNGLLLPHWGRWELDDRGVERLNLPTGLIQLLLRRIKNLSSDARAALKFAGLLTDQFDSEIIECISGLTKKNVDDAIAEALTINLIEAEPSRKFKFVHDKIREAFVSLWTENEAKPFHQAIGDYLFDHFDGDPGDLFGIAHHYGLGTIQTDPKRTFDTNFRAAKAAMENFSFKEGLALLQVCEHAASLKSDLRIVDFEEEFGFCCLQAGKYSDAEKHYEVALKLAVRPAQRARLLGKLAWVMTGKGDGEKTFELLDAAFKELGVRPLSHKLSLIMGAVISSLAAWFIDAFIGTLNPPRDQGLTESLQVLVELSTNAAYMAWRQVKFELTLLIPLRSALWSRRLGASRALVHGYAEFMVLCGFLRKFRSMETYFEKAMTLARQLNDQSSVAYIMVFHGHAHNGGGGSELETERLFREALPVAEKWGEPSVVVSGVTYYALRLIRRGLAKDLLPVLDKGLSCTDSVDLKVEILTFKFSALAMLGEMSAASEIFSQVEKHVTSSTSLSLKALFMVNAGIYLLEQNEFGEAADNLIAQHSKTGLGKRQMPGYARAFYLPALYIRLKQWQGAASDREKSARYAQLEEALDHLKKLGGTIIRSKLFNRKAKPEALILAHVDFVEGAIAAETGQWDQALESLGRAEVHARASDCQWVLFEVSKKRASIWKKRGYKIASGHALQEALNIAVAQGWITRQLQLRKEFGLDSQVEAPGAKLQTYTMSRSQIQDGKHLLLQRQLDALLKLSVASSEVFGLEDQCRVVMKEITRLLNPERIFLFLFDGHEERILLQLGQDASGAVIEDVAGYSKSIIEKVKVTKEPVVLTGTDQGQIKVTESIMAHNLRSILAAPLLSQGKLIGIVYLDSRVARGIFKENDYQLLHALGSYIAVAIESARTHQLQIEKSVLQKDLEVAGAVQNLLIPKVHGVRLGQIEAAAFSQTATQAGGDWWWLDRAGNGNLRAIIGDVTGHGVGSAMITAVVSGCFQTSKELIKDIEVPQLIETLNTIISEVCKDRYEMTFSIVEIDETSRRFTWWTMGAPPIFKMSKGEVEVVSPPGLSAPLGSGPVKLSKLEGEFAPGDQIMIFSDGLYEFPVKGGRQFGFKRLMNLFLKSEGPNGIQDQIAYIKEQTKLVRGSDQFQDDITLTLIKFHQ